MKIFKNGFFSKLVFDVIVIAQIVRLLRQPEDMNPSRNIYIPLFVKTTHISGLRREALILLMII